MRGYTLNDAQRVALEEGPGMLPVGAVGIAIRHRVGFQETGFPGDQSWIRIGEIL